MKRSAVPAEALARDAIGDHQNCALKYRLVRTPVPLEEAAQRFDSAYRLLLSAPPDDVPTPDGPARVTERHSCAYGARRFGHVIMEYHGRVVSLLMTTNDGGTGNVGQDAIPHLIGRPMNGLSVVSVNGTHHAILLVSDLDSAELAQLSRAVSVPLARRLEVSLSAGSRQLRFAAIRAVIPIVAEPPKSLHGLRLFDLHGCSGLQFVCSASRDLIAGLQIPEHFDQWAGRQPRLDVDPFRATASHADHKRAPGGARDTAGRHQERRRRATHRPLT